MDERDFVLLRFLTSREAIYVSDEQILHLPYGNEYILVPESELHVMVDSWAEDLKRQCHFPLVDQDTSLIKIRFNFFYH